MRLLKLCYQITELINYFLLLIADFIISDVRIFFFSNYETQLVLPLGFEINKRKEPE